MARFLKLAGVITVQYCLIIAVSAAIFGQFRDVDLTLPLPVATPFTFSTDAKGVSLAYFDSWHNMPSTINIRSPSQNHWASIFESPTEGSWDNGVFAYRDQVSIPLPTQTKWSMAWKPRIPVYPYMTRKVWPRRLGVHHWFLLVLCTCLFLIVHLRYIIKIHRHLFAHNQLSNRIWSTADGSRSLIG